MTFDPSKVDLSSLSQVSGGDDLDVGRNDDNLNFTMSEAVKTNPDSHAKVLYLSRKTDIPPFAVEADFDNVQQGVEVNEYDLNAVSKDSPLTAKYLEEINNAIIAQDDIPILQGIEDVMTTAKDYGSDVVKSFERGQLVVESSEIGLSRMRSILGMGDPVPDELMQRQEEVEAMLNEGRGDYGFFAGVPMAAAETLPIMGDIVLEGLKGAALGFTVGAALGSPGGRPGALVGGRIVAQGGLRLGIAKGAFDIEAGIAFNEFVSFKDDQGNLIDPETAARAAIVVGGVNAGLEALSLAALGRTVTPAMRLLIKSKVKRALATETGREVITRIGANYAKYLATETITEGLQEFVNVVGGEFAKFRDEDSFTEQNLSSTLDNIFSGETGERIVEAGVHGLQASILLGAPGTVATAVADRNERERLSESEQLRIDKVNELSEQSKVRERDKESFKQFVEDADGNDNTHVYIDGVQTSLYLQDKTPEEIDADPALKMLSEQAAEASVLGGDVQVPIADFAADVAGTDHFNQLRSSMKMNAESVSPFRQDQVKQETETYIKTLMDEAQTNTSEFVEAQEIYIKVRDQLIDTGQVTPTNASVMAQVIPAWATAQAKRYGKSVQQVYTDAGLTIEGPQTGEKARLQGEGVLTQAKASGFQGDTVVEASEWQKAVDKGLDMSQEARMSRAADMGFDTETTWYRGDETKINEYESYVTGRLYANDIGVFFDSDIDVAELYGDVVSEVYVRMDNPLIIDISRDDPSLIKSKLNLTSSLNTIESDLGAHSRASFRDSNNTAIQAAAIESGNDVVIIKDDEGELIQIFNPSQIRSIHAAFDPEFKESGDLLTQEPVTPDQVDEFSKSIEEELNLQTLLMIPNDKGNLKLQTIIVKKEDRKKGVGTEAMNRIIDYADQNGLRITLTPAVRDDFQGTTSRSRLVKFYKRFGFIENKGRNKDFEISESMYRPAQQPDLLAQPPVEQVSTETEAFKKWFGDSKVVDENGDPLIVHHGTAEQFEAFDPDRSIGGQFWFTTNKEAIEKGEVGAQGRGFIIDAYLSIQNPAGWKEYDSLTLDELIARGYDGLALKDGDETTYVAFEPTQIKSPESVGFDPTDPSIFRQRTGVQPEARGYYDPANSLIRLNESADLSTFLHEFAHFMYEMEVNGNTDMLQSINNWYKRNAEDVAKEANSYLGEDFDALKQGDQPTVKPGDITPDDVVAFLDNKTTGDADKDSAIHRAVHEQFARGFETYLMEGKAPSIELRNAFRTFARWLGRIYQQVRGQLNVNLDEEMREVFNRLLATEEQIAAAESRAKVTPMFTDAAMAGMTEEEFADYQSRQEKVKDVQTETLRDKLIKQLTRQTESWWKEEKQDLIDEELTRLKGEQVHVARARLKTGDLKLDHATVKELKGESRTDKRGRTSIHIPPQLIGMTAKGQAGVHPDEAAVFFGYNSGSEMMSDLMTAPQIGEAAEVAAEARMKETHGDILNDGTIEKEADEAVQNEERGKLILHELKMLARSTAVPAIDRKMIKDVAESRIGKLSFKEIQPGKYRNAEIRAAQESTRMLSEGNRDGAIEAKRKQVMNYYLGMAATDAKNETMKIVDRMGRYRKKKVREEIQKADNGYWDQIVKILSRFEFRKSATLGEVENINTWVKERNETDGDGLTLSPAVMNEMYLTHWKNVPFSDLQGVNDSVKNIEHVARYANKMKVAGETLDFRKLKESWIEHIKQQDQRFDTKSSRSRIDDSRDATAMEHIRRWASQLTKVPYMASWLDGGERAGMSHDVLVQPFTDALDAKIKMVDEVATPVLKAINSRSRKDMKRHQAKIWIPEIDDHLQGHQIVAVALNTGNQGNLKKLLLGEGWANPENEAEITFNNRKLQAVLQHMTKSDWEMVQLIWDQMELLYPQLAEVHRRTTGLVPPKVEATPRDVTIEGEVITMKGGYYPIKYSPRRSHKAAKNAQKLEAETESMFNNTASIQSSVNAGATNERTGFYDKIYLSLEVVPDHFNETIHYITHHDAVRQVNKLIQSPDVADAISGTLGEAEFNQLKPWLNDIAKDGRQQPTKTYVDEAFQKLRFGTTLGVMGFKVSTGIMQLFGVFTTTAELGVGPTMKAIYLTVGKSWYMNAIRRTLGSQEDMSTGWDFAVERSKVLQHRTSTMDREIRNVMESLKGKSGVLPAVQEASMKHIALIQTYMIDLPTWHAAYDKELSESGDEAKAIKRADWSVENLQGSGATKDMATIVRSQSKIHTTFTMFMTFFSALGNLSRDLVKGAKSGLYSPTSTTAKLMFLYTIPVFMEMLMRGDLDEPEDEDERLSKFATGVALYPIVSIPFVRDVASGVIGDYGYNVSPVASVLEKGVGGFKQISERVLTDEEITLGAVKGASKLTGAALGIPGVNQAWATGEHLYDVIEEGEELTTHQLIFGPERD